MEIIQIKNHLDEYLEFNSDILFNKSVDCASIFGGAIRDIISGEVDHIHDIDIVGMGKSIYNIYDILNKQGYKKIDLVKPNIHDIYKHIKYIFEPITLINKNQKIVQLIRPSQVTIRDKKIGTFIANKISYIRLLKNVDLSSSGLFYDGENIYESVPDAYIHCKSKVFEEQKDAMMYNNQRTLLRKEKLTYDRGWNEFNPNGLNDKVLIRKLKINSMKKYNVKTIDDYEEKIKKIGYEERRKRFVV